MNYLKTYKIFEDLLEKRITCGIYLFDINDLLLIQHPTKFRPTLWSIPKGRIDIGETDEFEVAKRELFEETGIDLNDLTIIRVEEFDEIKYKESNKYLKSFFVKVEDDLQDFNLHCDSMVMRNDVPVFPEVDEWKWVTIEEAIKIFSGDGKSDFQLDNLYLCKKYI